MILGNFNKILERKKMLLKKCNKNIIFVVFIFIFTNTFFINKIKADNIYQMGVTGTDVFFSNIPGSAASANFFIKSTTGNIGIGMANANPTAKIHLGVGTTAAGSAPLKFTNNATGWLTIPEAGSLEFSYGHLYFTNAAGGRTQLDEQSGTGTIVNANSFIASTSVISPLIYGSQSASGTLYIDSTTHATKGVIALAKDGGSVGIGTITPNAKFSIFGTKSDTVGAIPYLGFDTDGINPLFGFRIGADNNLYLDRQYSSVGYNVMSFLRSSGNVGIGTTSPSGILHTSTSLYASTPLFERNGQTSDLIFGTLRVLATKTTSMNDGFGANITFNIKDDAGAENIISHIGAVRAGADNTGDLVFYPYAAGVGAEKMRITSGGNVGINDTTPSEKLEVTGNIKSSGVVSGTSFSGSTSASVPLVINTAGNLTLQSSTGNIVTTPLAGYGIRNSGYIDTIFPSGNEHYQDVVNYSGASTVTGTMDIKLPVSWVSNMMVIRIVGYNYSGTGAWELVVSGYNYSTTPAWYNYTAELKGDAPFSQVRLAHDGTNNVILLGTTTTTWSYPRIVVTDVYAMHSSPSLFGTGWAITPIVDESMMAYVATPTLKKIATTNTTEVFTNKTISTGSVWNGGTISIAYGGTNSTATPTSGGIAYGNGSAIAYTAVGTANQVLVSNGAAAPTWNTLDMTYIPDAAFKKSVKVATTAAITLSAPQTIDGVAVIAGDRVLVKNQATASTNGIYVVAAGAWTRSTDADSITEVAGSLVNVDSGTQGGFLYSNDLKITDSLGTTNMPWYALVNDSRSQALSNKSIIFNANTAAAGSAPIKLTAGTLMSTPETGAIEFDGTHFWATVGTTRYQLDSMSSSIISANTFIASTSVITPLIYGSQAASGTLYLDSTTHATKGIIALAKDGGNVGIGTIAPGQRLTVDQLSYSLPATTGTTQTGALRVQASTGGNVVLDIGTSGGTNGTWLQTTNKGDLSIEYPLLLQPNGGNLGIGTTTPGTIAEIQRVETVNRTSYNDILTITANATTNPYTGHGGGILFKGTNYRSASNNVNYAQIGSTISDHSAATTGSNLFFNVSPLDDGVLARAMTIDYNGRVGIGVTSPADKLAVIGGNIAIDGTSKIYDGAAADTSGLTFAGSALNLSGYNGIIFKSSATNLTSQTERMRITNAGNVGIGIAAPSQQLEITQNFEMPATTKAAPYGVIYKGAAPFLHNFSYGNNGTVTTIGENTFLGLYAGNLTMGTTATLNYHASRNVGIGDYALNANTIGYYNAGVGYYALAANTSGYYNAGVGYQSLNANTTGAFNSGMGMYSLRYITTTNYNTGLGAYSGTYIADGSTPNITADNSLYLGSNTKASSDGRTNEIVIGASTIGIGSNTVTLGNTSITTTLLRGKVGIGVVPDAYLRLPAGGSAATTAPIKFGYGIGIKLATPETGTIEFDGNHFWVTTGYGDASSPVIRTQLDQQAGAGLIVSANTFDAATSVITPVIYGDRVGTNSYGLVVYGNLGTNYDIIMNPTGGNVGIGNLAPAQKLEVTGIVKADHFYTGYNWTGKTGGLNLGVDGVNGGIGFYNGVTAASASIYRDTDSKFYVGARSGITTYGLVIDTLGNIGMGTTSLYSNVKGLQVENTKSSVNTGIIGVFDNTAQATGVGGRIILGGRYINSDPTNILFAGIEGVKENATSNNYAGALVLSTIANAGNLSEKMRITSAGNVGIGTASPDFLTKIYNNSTSNSSLFAIEQAGTGDAAMQFRIAGSMFWRMGVDNSDSDRFKISNASGGDDFGTDMLTITSGGSVGIGTTGPAQKLHVFGSTGNVYGRFGAQTTYYMDVGYDIANERGYLQAVANGVYDDVLINPNGGGVAIGSATTYGYTLFVGTGGIKTYGFTEAYTAAATYAMYSPMYNYSSDQRLKTNILPLTNSLSKILNVSGYSFNWKDTTNNPTHDKIHIGLIAQDIEKEFPELVSTDPRTGYKTVEYANMVAPLIEAMKEQQKQIDELKLQNEKVLKQNIEQQKQIDLLLKNIK